MTVFNGERFLREAIESVLNQTLTDFEFLIVDNASQDKSIGIINSFKDKRINLIRNAQNLGQTKALNLGLQKAVGKYIARMDADDISLPHRLEKQLEFLDTHNEAAVVGGWHAEINENGEFIKTMRYPIDPDQIKFHLLTDGNLTRRCLAHPTVMFLKKAVLEVGGYNESVKFAQDYDLWTRVAGQYEIYNLPEVVLKYRVNQKSTSRTNMPEMKSELDRIVQDHLNRIWPDLPQDVNGLLTDMLRNRSIHGQAKGKNVYRIFDDLFHRYAGGNETSKSIRIREQIKMYYLPRLFSKDPGFSSLYFLKTVGRFPLLPFDSKFLKNVAKIAVH